MRSDTLHLAFDQPKVTLAACAARLRTRLSASDVTSILEARCFRKATVGLRGWRVRRDLPWGVSPDELEKHGSDGWKLAEPFRIGVLTANEGYLIKPRFFLDSSRHQNFIKDWGVRAPVLNVQKLNETAAHLVDDIWLNGHLSARGVARYVVPLTASSSSFSLSTIVLANDAVSSIDVRKAHTLEGRMA